MKPIPIQVQIAAPSSQVAQEIAAALVAERLAACVQILGPAQSIFRWHGEIDVAEEWILLIKTTDIGIGQLQTRVRQIHPYECPEIIGLPIIGGDEVYLDWLRAQVGPSPN